MWCNLPYPDINTEEQSFQLDWQMQSSFQYAEGVFNARIDPNRWKMPNIITVSFDVNCQ